ncbi:putative reverse transcriptase domain-containing protein [Tanacetum coccineum]
MTAMTRMRMRRMKMRRMKEEEEHLAPADSAVVVPTVELVSPPDEIEPVTPPPSIDITTTGARITVRTSAIHILLPKAEVEASSPWPTATLLSPLIYTITTLCTAPSMMVIGSSTTRPIEESGIDIWVDPTEAVLEMAPMPVREKEEAYASREAWAHTIGLSQAIHYELQTHCEQVYAHESQLYAHQTQLQLQVHLINKHSPVRVVSTAKVARGELTAKYQAIVPDHQEASRDAEVKFATCTLLGAALTCWNGQIRTLGPDALFVCLVGNDLMEQKLRHLCRKEQTDTKRKVDDSSRNNHGQQQQPFKRHNVTKGSSKNVVFDVEAPGSLSRRECPKFEDKEGEIGNAQGWVYAVGNAEKNGNASRNPDSNVVTGTFLLNNRYASILFDTGADRSFISTAFSSLIDIAPTPLENSYDVEFSDRKY